MQITRGIDNAFKCGCGKVFRNPITIQKHAKGCNGELVSLDDTLMDGDISAEEDDSDAPESDHDPMDETPEDCIGRTSRRCD